MTGDRWLIAGLGNPGPQYAGQRHNAGAMVAAELATRMGVTLRRDRSGAAVASLRGFYKVPPERVLILHDELDLAFGMVRLKLGGGDNGHNGLRSVTAALGPGYHRLRIGIGRPPGRMDPAAFVLRDFSKAERDTLPALTGLAADAAESLLRDGLAVAQNDFHSRDVAASR
jgi:peptidyl-tRNA hydrolase, PTH1 family